MTNVTAMTCAAGIYCSTHIHVHSDNSSRYCSSQWLRVCVAVLWVVEAAARHSIEQQNNGSAAQLVSSVCFSGSLLLYVVIVVGVDATHQVEFSAQHKSRRANADFALI